MDKKYYLCVLTCETKLIDPDTSQRCETMLINLDTSVVCRIAIGAIPVRGLLDSPRCDHGRLPDSLPPLGVGDLFYRGITFRKPMFWKQGHR